MNAFLNDIRSRFPALERRHNGLPVAYFDGPGGTQVPREVGEAMVDYLYHHNANAHWAYPTSRETDEALAEARATAAAFLNADPSEVVFGPNMTTLAFHLSRALASRLSDGDEVLVTELDHHANVAPWTRLAQECGATVRTVRMNVESGQLDWDHFEQVVGPKTRLVAIGAASNALGTITDVRRATQLAHSVGAWCFIDAVHYAPHELVDVQAFDCDFLACSSYKFYGPHVGMLFGKRDVLTELDFPKLIPAPDSVPERAETGTQNHEGIVGTSAAIRFLASLSEGDGMRERLRKSYDALRAAGRELVQRLWSGLKELDGIQVFGPDPSMPRTPTVSFFVHGVSSDRVCEQLAEKALFVSNGDFYARTVIERLGVDGLIRIGCACYTSRDEIDRLLDALSDIGEAMRTHAGSH